MNKNRFIKIESVLERCAISRATLYRLIKQGDFPRQVHLSQRAVGWLESDVDEWIDSRRRSATAYL
ncbi:AlpA family transcriptional regulator [Escherichia coli]|nr:AlpA family transcriptional regulator [Escherichia coli]EIB8314438.1 AlpA family transcriptional regulator [Escherichia coli]ELS9459234.1 AlpA family transcriptional regulator [Escherichia coli]ELW1472424.1 AlpA family transcriptional regulator [Escherichia coli]ELY7481013.1 AlpA family transcriptional regulator [Escherichia coli]